MTVTASNFERRAHDLYETEEWATEALLRIFPVEGLSVWEPAAGNHKMAIVLARSARKVITSDIVTHDRAHNFVRDFLKPSNLHKGDYSAIITNPPYGRGNRTAVKFIEQALDLCQHGIVAMLLTAKFDFGKTRHHLFRDNPRFMAKIALVDRISWAGNGRTGTEDNAWYVWGPVTMHRYKPEMFWEGKTL